MEQAIYSILASATNVTAIVGTKIAPAYQAQFTELPFITYQIEGYEPTITQSGTIVAAKTTVQIDAWANTYKAATLLQLSIRRALQGYKGLIATINVRNITTDGRTSLTLQTPDGAEKPIYASSSNYDILHIETE